MLLVGSVAIPAVLLALVAWVSYRGAVNAARNELVRTSQIAREHASKVFDSQSGVADSISDIVRGMDIATIERSEKELHEAFARLVARFPQIQSVLLVARDGRPLVSAGTYPVPTNLNVSNRDYFSGVMHSNQGTYVSSLQTGDINRQLFFGLARPWVAPDGTLAGVIDVAVSPAFFRDFYEAIIREGADSPTGKVLTLIRADGQILVRYPPFAGPAPRAPADSPFLRAIARNADHGVYPDRSIVDSNAPARLFAYSKVEGYPVYVVAGESFGSIAADWRTSLAGDLVIGIPLSLALLAVTWTALVRINREEQALERARSEIERRETAEAALLRAQRLEAVGQMTGGVAHDFNNLLTVVLGSAEMMDRRADEPASVRRIAGQIALAARRGAEITQQLLAFSRKQVIRPEIIDLNGCLQEFSQLLERAAGEAVRLELDLDLALAPARLDPGHFEAAILNLVGNARDAMPEGGRVLISTRDVTLKAGEFAELPPGRYAKVTVSDDGDGMAPETLAKAFEPFFTTKEVGRGTGLGLSQVYGFAKQAGGDVRITSAIGDGTRVAILLPCVKAGPTDRAGIAPSRPGEGRAVAADRTCSGRGHRAGG